MKLSLNDIGVIEFHEAFAGQLYIHFLLIFFADFAISFCSLVPSSVARTFSISTNLTTHCFYKLISTGQVLANMAAMGSEKFCADRLPGGKVVGNFDFSKVNTRGGSLSLGHPFGATGEWSKCVNSEFFSCVVLPE